MLGGSGSPEEVRETIASRLAISDDEQEEQLPSGSSRFDNQVAWARFYLTRAGLLDSSRRGIWSLTEKGRASTLPDTAALDLFKELHKQFAVQRKSNKKDEEALDESSPETLVAPPQVSSHREALLTLIKSLPAAGFERLCQRLVTADSMGTASWRSIPSSAFACCFSASATTAPSVLRRSETSAAPWLVGQTRASS